MFERARALARSYALVRFCTRVQLLHTPALFHTIDVHGNRLTTHIISSSQNHCHSHEKNEEYGMAGGFCWVRMRVACGLRVGAGPSACLTFVYDLKELS